MEDPVTIKIESLIIELNNHVYKPAEDTFLLLDTIKYLIKSGRLDFKGKEILELGTGVGLIALWIAIKAPTSPNGVVATDISPKAIRCIKRNMTLNQTNNIAVICSDLFSAFSGDAKFDIILFNPPYVPTITDPIKKPNDWEDRTWHGGAQGRMIIDQFLLSFSNYLSDTGEALILHSSLNNPEKTSKIVKAKGFHMEIVGKTKLPWEILMVLELMRDQQVI
ncbi:MAG: HemK2/MTQ2 family protein methyltransferase [Candidatus Heimdallarchaeota archaeon]